MSVVRNTTVSVRNEEIRHGESVEVTMADGKTAERIVWRVDGGLVFVCTEKTYERLQRGDLAALPIGFPIDDVRALA